jgi:hypothetical protein
MPIYNHTQSTGLKAVCLSALLILSSSFATAQKVSTDYDHLAKFGNYHTFSIYKLQASSSLFEQRLRDDLTRTLTSKGLQLVPGGGDLAVTAIGSRKNQQEYNSFY